MAFITNLTNAVGYSGVYVNGQPSGIDNDQGNIRGQGPSGVLAGMDANLWSQNSLGEDDYFTLIASGVGNTGIIAPATASTFNNQPGQVIVKVTTDLAGVSNLTQSIRSAAGDSGVISINQEAIIGSLDYKTSVVAGNWNVFSGAFSPALSTTIAGGWNIIGDAEQGGTLVPDKTDKAANPSAEEPGHLAYMAGNLGVPNTGLYSARTTW